ncbi:MAG: HD domain-containing protein [Candidatus Aenigmarchaeota archaeon]|nr:HD domain-containing protein [Candidatus Aenigmarchaeota archaeon]
MDTLILQAKNFFESNIPKSRDKKSYIIHVELVRKYAKLLGKLYSANLIVLETTALLHDVGADSGRVHAQKSADITEKFLSKKTIDTNTKNKILSAIKNHSMMQKSEEFRENISLEDQILRDADGIAFLCDTFKPFFDKAVKKYGKEKGIELSIDKINAMRAKVKTKKGVEIADRFYPTAFEYISNTN